MKLLEKDVNDELKILECDKNFIRKLYRNGYQKLKFSSRYKIYVTYKANTVDVNNYNCALSTPKSPLPLNIYGAFYVKKNFLFWNIDVRDFDVQYIKKFIDKSIKNYR